MLRIGAALAQVAQDRLVLGRPAGVVERELDRRHLDRQHVGQRRAEPGRRGVQPAGDDHQAAALGHEVLDPVPLLAGEVVGVHVADDEQVVGEQVLALVREVGEERVPGLHRLAVAVDDDERRVDAAVALERLQHELEFPPRVALDVEHLHLAVGDADHLGEAVFQRLVPVHDLDRGDDLLLAGRGVVLVRGEGQASRSRPGRP